MTAAAQIAPAGERPTTDRTGAAYAAALFAMLGWASLYPAAKPALQEVTPLMVALARAAIACLALSLLTCVTQGGLAAGLRHLRVQSAVNGRGIAALGVISFTGTSIVAMTAQQFLPASINGLLNNLGPLWLALYTAAAGRARHGGLLIAGSLVAAGGVALVLLGDGSLLAGGVALGGQAWIGIPLSLGGSVLIACSTLVVRRVVAGRDALAVTALATGWGAIPLLIPVLFGIGGSMAGYVSASSSTKALLLWLGTGSTAFNFALWFYALAHLPVTRISNFQYLILPLGVALSVLLLGEPLGTGLLAGTAAIVAGIVLAHRGAEAAPARPRRTGEPA